MLLLFPTFPMRSSDFDISSIPGLDAIYRKWTARAKEVIPRDLGLLDPSLNNEIPFTAITEQAHYACMIENLSLADWVAENIGKCTYASSYSMGLYSALIHSQALDFEPALKLVQAICRLAQKASEDNSWSVGAVIQFPVEKLTLIMRKIDVSLEITDIFGPHTILFTGNSSSVKKVLDLCLEDGASLTRLIPLTAPFHTTTLKRIAPKLDELIGCLSINAPSWPILSSLNQNWLTTAEDVRAELRRNVWAPMDWNSTMERLAELNEKTMVECGASISLAELARPILGAGCNCLDFRDLARA